MKPKQLIFVFAALFFWINAQSQQIKLRATDKALNLVLIEIRDKYNVQFSFNDSELAKFLVSVDKSFPSPEKALEYLFSDLPFEFEKSSGVYIIFRKKSEIVKQEIIKPKIYSISGRILEYRTNEFLPYTLLYINSFGTTTDQNGNFRFSSLKDSVFSIKVSSLGYVIEDTVLVSGNHHVKIYLSPSDQIVEEVLVKENVLETFVNSGNQAATIKLNHKVSKFLPGSSDNSVFNILRLQPGVLASGEQTNDLIVWGSYAGQSKIEFDGFTVFGLKNFNDNISAINPLIVKSMQLQKAGYDASYGDYVGGILEINGRDGNMQTPHFELGINNYTLNSLLEIPLFKVSSLQVAYRQTYYNLYNEGLNLFPKTSNLPVSEYNGIVIYPDYKFRDYNLKYSIKKAKSYFYISFLNSNDNFSYSLNQIRQYREIVKNTNETNHQTGASAFLEFSPTNRIKSQLNFSYSELSGNIENKFDVFSTITGKLVGERDFLKENAIRELKAKMHNMLNLGKNQNLEIDFEAVNQVADLNTDSAGVAIQDTETRGTHYTFGFKDVFSFPGINLTAGARYSFVPESGKSYFEPRISLAHQINDKVKYNLAWGIYRQFLVKSSSVDEYGNYSYFWTIADELEIPVLKSYHYVSSFSFNNNKFSANLDAFYRQTFGLTRYIRLLQIGVEDIFTGDSKAWGLDVYAKYNFGKHTIWASYTLSETLEHFSYQKNDDYLYAPQDQRHEIKLAGIISLEPFYLSGNYVYGTGFLEKPFQQKTYTNRLPYSRLDVSVTYKFAKKKFLGECGISILNVLNTQNQKYTNFEKIPITQLSTVAIYYEAVPFTPSIFLKIRI